MRASKVQNYQKGTMVLLLDVAFGRNNNKNSEANNKIICSK